MQVIIDQNLNVQVLLGSLDSTGNALFNKSSSVTVIGGGGGRATVAGGDTGGDVNVDANGNLIAAAGKDSLLASWPFVIGISSATLVISIVLGILLAKRKIKKGFELYED